MKQSYTVFSSHVANIPTKVSLEDGSEVEAPVARRVVQLVPIDAHDRAGTIKLVLPPSEESERLFKEGDVVDVNFSAPK
jgi:hypothetical protein